MLYFTGKNRNDKRLNTRIICHKAINAMKVTALVRNGNAKRQTKSHKSENETYGNKMNQKYAESFLKRSLNVLNNIKWATTTLTMMRKWCTDDRAINKMDTILLRISGRISKIEDFLASIGTLQRKLQTLFYRGSWALICMSTLGS